MSKKPQGGEEKRGAVEMRNVSAQPLSSTRMENSSTAHNSEKQWDRIKAYIVLSVMYWPYVHDALCKTLDDIRKIIPFHYADIRRIDYNTLRLTVLAHKICDDSDNTQMEPARPGCSRLGDRNPTIEQGITGYVALSKMLHYAPDVKDDPYYTLYRDETQSAIAFPLKLGGEMLGVLLLESDDPDAFTEDQGKWLESIAIFIAAALQRERQELSEEGWLRRYEALGELNLQIADSQNLDKLLQDIARNIQGSIDGCALCRFVINDPDKQRLHIMASETDENSDSSATGNVRLLQNASIAGEVIRSGQPRFIRSLEGEKNFTLRKWARRNEYYAALFLPLRDPQDKNESLGCIVLYARLHDAGVLKDNQRHAEQIASTVAQAFSRLRKTLPNSAFQTTIEEYSKGSTPRAALQDVIEIARERTGGQYGSIFLFRSNGLTLAATTGVDKVSEEGYVDSVISDNYSEVIYKTTEEESRKHRTSWVAYHRKPLRILSQNDPEETTGGMSLNFEEPYCWERGDTSTLDRKHLLERGFLAAPIQATDPKTGEEKFMGVIRVVHKQDDAVEGGLPFTPVDQLILEAIGRALGLGILSAERIAHDQNMLNRIGKHNLLQPVAQARNDCGFLLDRVDLPPDKVRAKLQEMHTALKQAQDGIDILSSLTNIQNEPYDGINKSTQNVNLTERLDTIIGMLKEMARPKNLDFRTDFEESEKAFVMGNEEWLTRAFYELLYNAVKHSIPDSNINITLCRQDGFWRLSVQNRGKTLPNEEMRLLWEPGTRSDTTLGYSIYHGYGLADMRNIVKRHKGRAGVETPIPVPENNSLADWQFFIDLPVAEHFTVSRSGLKGD